MEPRRTLTLSLAPSTPPVEKEHRRASEALDRCAPSDLAFDPSRWSPEALSSVRSAWVERMAAEHGSFPVFAQLATQLAEAGASLDLQSVALRMAHDEVRHAELCGRVVEALGGVAECTVEGVVAPLARHPGCSPEERALRNVIYTTCLSEMVAVSRFVDAIDHTEDAFLRDAGRRLLADEVLHGQFGFHYLDAWAPWLGAHPETLDSLERYLRHALAVIEGRLAGTSPVQWTATDEERALGGADPARGREVFYGTLEGAVLPALERYGIRAERAWRERRIDAGAERVARLA